MTSREMNGSLQNILCDEMTHSVESQRKDEQVLKYHLIFKKKLVCYHTNSSGFTKQYQIFVKLGWSLAIWSVPSISLEILEFKEKTNFLVFDFLVRRRTQSDIVTRIPWWVNTRITSYSYLLEENSIKKVSTCHPILYLQCYIMCMYTQSESPKLAHVFGSFILQLSQTEFCL